MDLSAVAAAEAMALDLAAPATLQPQQS